MCRPMVGGVSGNRNDYRAKDGYRRAMLPRHIIIMSTTTVARRFYEPRGVCNREWSNYHAQRHNKKSGHAVGREYKTRHTPPGECEHHRCGGHVAGCGSQPCCQRKMSFFFFFATTSTTSQVVTNAECTHVIIDKKWFFFQVSCYTTIIIL